MLVFNLVVGWIVRELFLMGNFSAAAPPQILPVARVGKRGGAIKGVDRGRLCKDLVELCQRGE